MVGIKAETNGGIEMKSIEERAYRKSLKMLNSNSRAVPTTRELLIEMAIEQRTIDIEQIPQLYVRWMMIDGEKPSWKEYAKKEYEKH